MITLVEGLLRVVAALVLGDPAVGPAPLLAVAALGLTAVAIGVVVVHLLAVVLGTARLPRPGPAAAEAAELVTRIAWSHPDADGHVRGRAPGAPVPA